jgi:hypothetical protein
MSTAFNGHYGRYNTLGAMEPQPATKRYKSKFQQSKALCDVELVDIQLESENFLKQLITANFPRGSSINDGFKIIESPADNQNNFRISGGDGTVDGAGILFVDGYILFIKSFFDYKDQNNALLITDDAYTATGLPALTTPPGPGPRTDIVYVDFYFAEVSYDTGSEYQDLSLMVLGVNSATSNRVRQVQDIRVAEGTAVPVDGADANGIWHKYIPIATLNRLASTPSITQAMIVDNRILVNSVSSYCLGTTQAPLVFANGTTIGDATHRVSEIFMSSSVDYATDLIFKSSGEKIRFMTSGNIGVGITNPSSALCLSDGTITLKFDHTTLGVIGTESAHDLSIRTHDIERIRIIDSTGFVGVGTSSPLHPTTLLQVQGDTVITGSLDVSGTTTITNTEIITTDEMEINQSSLTLPALVASLTAPTSTATAVKIQNAGTGYALIIDKGNVGIGITNPSGALCLSDGTINVRLDHTTMGVVGTDSAHDFSIITGGAEKIRIVNSNGRIGVGTTNPGTLLDVNGDATIRTVAAYGSPATLFLTHVSGLIESRTASQVLSDIGAASSGSISGTTNKIAIFASASAVGNSLHLAENATGVGIGTTNPTSLLDVKGQMSVSSIAPSNNTGITSLTTFDGASFYTGIVVKAVIKNASGGSLFYGINEAISVSNSVFDVNSQGGLTATSLNAPTVTAENSNSGDTLILARSTVGDPVALFEADITVPPTSGYLFQGQANDGANLVPVFQVDYAGRVGIGTTISTGIDDAISVVYGKAVKVTGVAPQIHSNVFEAIYDSDFGMWSQGSAIRARVINSGRADLYEGYNEDSGSALVFKVDGLGALTAVSLAAPIIIAESDTSATTLIKAQSNVVDSVALFEADITVVPSSGYLFQGKVYDGVTQTPVFQVNYEGTTYIAGNVGIGTTAPTSSDRRVRIALDAISSPNLNVALESILNVSFYPGSAIRGTVASTSQKCLEGWYGGGSVFSVDGTGAVSCLSLATSGTGNSVSTSSLSATAAGVGPSISPSATYSLNVGSTGTNGGITISTAGTGRSINIANTGTGSAIYASGFSSGSNAVIYGFNNLANGTGIGIQGQVGIGSSSTSAVVEADYIAATGGYLFLGQTAYDRKFSVGYQGDLYAKGTTSLLGNVGIGTSGAGAGKVGIGTAVGTQQVVIFNKGSVTNQYPKPLEAIHDSDGGSWNETAAITSTVISSSRGNCYEGYNEDSGRVQIFKVSGLGAVSCLSLATSGTGNSVSTDLLSATDAEITGRVGIGTTAGTGVDDAITVLYSKAVAVPWTAPQIHSNTFESIYDPVDGSWSTGSAIRARVILSSRADLYQGYNEDSGSLLVYRVDGTGQIYSSAGTTITTPADFAEWARVKGNLDDYEVGTVVMQSVDDDFTVTTANDFESVYGVVTDRATFLGGLTDLSDEERKNLMNMTDDEIENKYNAKKIAMVGHIKVKVKGAVNRGQRLVLSDEPGVAQAAITTTEKMMSFAIARESHKQDDISLIEVRLL